MPKRKLRFAMCLSADDYLYPARCFVFVELPPAAERALTSHTRT